MKKEHSFFRQGKRIRYLLDDSRTTRHPNFTSASLRRFELRREARDTKRDVWIETEEETKGNLTIYIVKLYNRIK